MVDRIRVALAVTDAYVAVTAIGGGIALATGAERERFPSERLHGTPFHGYLVPGMVLAGVLTGAPPRRPWSRSAVLGRQDRLRWWLGRC
jgi:hypothetical protein